MCVCVCVCGGEDVVCIFKWVDFGRLFWDYDILVKVGRKWGDIVYILGNGILVEGIVNVKFLSFEMFEE